QVSQQRRQPVVLTFQPAVLDQHILALSVAGFAQTFAETGNIARVTICRSVSDKSYHRHRGLLRAHCWRPSCSRGANKKCNELAPPHSITSSAATCTVCGTLMPSVLAALRLRTNWTFMDCWTGRSPGFSPLRMRPT